MKPRFDILFGIWRCWLPGTRVAGFGVTPKDAWDEFLRDVRQRLGEITTEQMGS